MDRDNLKAEIYDTLIEIASDSWAADKTNTLMAAIDRYVETSVTKAKLTVMKSFGAI